MKKLKKIVSILLCLLMAAAALAMPAAAYYDEDIGKKGDLFNKTGDMIDLANQKLYSYDSRDRTIYTNETFGLLWEKTDTISNYYYDYNHNDMKWYQEPLEHLQQMYDELVAAYEGLKVNIIALRDLYEKVKDEENESSYSFTGRYYPERMWRGFCAVRQTAKDVLAAEYPSDDTVTGAYFALRSAFNELCKSNQMAGDINGTGYITIEDVLCLQKYLAGIVKLNSSQKAVANLSGYSNYQASLNDVVILQKLIAGIDVYVASSMLGDLNCSDKNPLIDTGWII